MRQNGRPACQLSMQRNRGHSLHRQTFARHYVLRNVSLHPLAVFFHAHSFCTDLDGSNTPAFARTPYDPARRFFDTLRACPYCFRRPHAQMRRGTAVELDQQHCMIGKHPTANALFDPHCQQPPVRCNVGKCTS